MIKLSDSKIIVTGGEGFVGSALCATIRSRGATPVVLRHGEGNLLNLHDTINFFIDQKADYCVHCAGYNGGIEFNIRYPAEILYTNTIMGLNLYHACEYSQIKKLVSIMTSCAYPDTGMENLSEDSFWNGQPNKTIRAHGIAKRTLQAAAEAYEKQYNFHSVSTCVTNLYGPYDTFDLIRTKVVGALIRKFVEGQKEYEEFEEAEVVCWGTGTPRREFMYVSDAAEGIIQALEKYDDVNLPLNIGTGNDITIKELVNHIIDATGYQGEVVWDKDKPDGQIKKLLDVSRMKGYIDVSPRDTKEGILETVKWYTSNKKWADERK